MIASSARIFLAPPGLVAVARGAIVLGLCLAAAAAAAPVLEDHPARVLVEAPSEVGAGQTFRVTALLQVRWGPAGPDLPTAGVPWSAPLDVFCTDDKAEIPKTVYLGRAEGGRGVFEAALGTPGLHHIELTAEGGLVGISNPIRVLPEPPVMPVLWGDLHVHLHTPGAGHGGRIPAEQYGVFAGEALAYARDASNLDFCALTPHMQTAGGLANPDSTGVSPWDALLSEIERAHTPGSFVTLPGFEWQGNEGDHCVIWPEAGPFIAPAAFAALAESVSVRHGILFAPAIRVPTTFEPYSPERIAVEVARDARSTEALGLEAIRRGLVPAFIGSSGTHGGAAGSTALTGMRTHGYSRTDVLAAIRLRRTWATNGERIVLDFAVDGAAPVPVVTVRGTGTDAIEAIEVYRNAELVARARGFGPRPEFEFTWEDEDLLRAECVAGPVVYHAKVIQTSANRYQPSARDFAIASPVAIELSAENWNAAYARGGGDPLGEPGSTLANIHDVWNALRSDPGRPLRSPLPAELPRWSASEVDALEAAVRALTQLATKDSALVALANDLSTLPALAEGIQRLRAAEVAEAAGAALDRVEGAAREANEAAGVASAQAARARPEDLVRAWSAAESLAPRAEQAWRRAAAAARLGSDPVLRAVGEVSRLPLPDDPRVWAAVRAPSPRAVQLRRELEERMGATVLSEAGQEHGSDVLVRVVAEGSPGSGRLVDPADGWSVSLEGTSRGWTAHLPASRVPLPGAAPPALEFDPPADVSALYLEDERGRSLPSPGRVVRYDLAREGVAIRLSIDVAADSVVAELQWQNGDGQRGWLWSGMLPVGSHERAFVIPPQADSTFVLRWGFAGWRRAGSVEIPGHEIVHPRGLGVLSDGRAAIGLGSGLRIVDPRSGDVDTLAWPAGRTLDEDRGFCVSPLPDGRALVRGGDAGTGGWARALDPVAGTWAEIESGPESGTVVTTPAGDIVWLTGQKIRRRAPDGSPGPTLDIDRTGRLLGFDPAGRPVVRILQGHGVRLSPLTGGVAASAEGPILALDPAGAMIRLAGLDARDAELALAIDLELALADGSRPGPFRLAFRPFPAGPVPVLAAVTPDGALLLLGGTTWWRRGPGHDWWGATLERWEPIWAGESRIER